MNKQLQTLILLMSFAFSGNAQFQYGVYEIPFQLSQIDQDSALGLQDNYFSAPINIGFPFTFFGNTYSSLCVFADGYVRFLDGVFPLSGGFSDYTIEQIPSPEEPLNSIFLMWNDLDCLGDSNIYYSTMGDAPNRVFIVHFADVALYSCNNLTFNGQLKLFEGTNNIEFHVLHKPLCNIGWSQNATQGIQNFDGTLSYHIPGRNGTDGWQTSLDAWRFDPDTMNALTCQINGRVFVDLNGDCVLNGIDYALPNQVVIRDIDQVYVTSNQNGVYSFEVAIGDYNISLNGLLVDLPFGTVNCPSDAQFNLSITEAGTIADSLDFFIYTDSSCTDLQVSISPMGPFRRCAGNDNHQMIYVSNHGLLPIEGYSVSLTIPDSLYLYNTVPAFSSQDGNTFTWNFSDTLVYGELTWIHLYDSLSCYTTDGLIKCISAAVSTSSDCNETNNSMQICQIVNGSYDPNHIQLLSAPPAPQYVYNMEVEGTEQWYTYRIQFQNTGTAPAQTVVVTDILPSFFDYSSAEFLGSSHECMMVNSGDGTLKFVHYFINLPDSSEDFDASIGTVLFKVKALQTLLPGQEVSNRASIVFDVNDPVITNDAIFKVPMPEGVQVVGNQFNYFPNPANQSLLIQTKTAQVEIRISDLSGRLVLSEILKNESTPISTQDIPAGVYFIKLFKGNQLIGTQKLIVAH